MTEFKSVNQLTLSHVSRESTETTKMNSRRRPMHTCGLAFMAIVHEACIKVQDFNGPTGSVTKKIAKIASLASPLVSALQYQLLATLSSLDDRILAVEDAVEAVFPPSEHVFKRIDKLVQIVETLPGKFDDAMNKFPLIIHQVPFLDWALVVEISWLNFLISTLAHWVAGSQKEKEIVVDTNCNENTNGSAFVQDEYRKTESENHERNDIMEDSDLPEEEGTEIVSPKVSYKDALEKGKKENIQNKEDGIKEEIQTSNVCREETKEEIKNPDSSQQDNRRGEMKGNNLKQKEDGAKEVTKNTDKKEESISRSDPILELFESAWQMTPRKKSKESSFPRSISYQW